jgi:hypothetical protein
VPNFLTRKESGMEDRKEPAMTTIKASCPVCGDVELTPAQMRLVVCSRPEWSYYAFLCTRCQDEVRKPADSEVVALLISGGVAAEEWDIPAEALEEKAGPAISYDDVLDFLLALEQVDRLAGTLDVAPQGN